MRLHWKKDGNRWVTEEQRAGTPDFIVTVVDGMYRLKMRSARQATLHDTLTDAKDYAEAV